MNVLCYFSLVLAAIVNQHGGFVAGVWEYVFLCYLFQVFEYESRGLCEGEVVSKRQVSVIAIRRGGLSNDEVQISMPLKKKFLRHITFSFLKGLMDINH
ncbi:MAG: hypothetical protein KKD31_09450 [Bacteroidetes bacterium]|nr:hypothetical protein [Bacteroidota bacterium]